MGVITDTDKMEKRSTRDCLLQITRSRQRRETAGSTSSADGKLILE